jgi:NTP pyrophosphatase (non-canonical NTP hydrolase)
MNFNEYQDLTTRTAGTFEDKQTELVAWAMGIGGESGEVVDIIKKHVFHGHELESLKTIYELGDLLFYIARMANALGCTLEDVAEFNIEKLEKRYPEGFSTERSVNRED